MHTVSKSFKFCAAHRLLGHKGKCRYLHGHNYAATVTVGPRYRDAELDGLGMVLDFEILKDRIGLYINSAWDHNTLVHIADPLLKVPDVFGDRIPFVMDENPTAENMAKVLFREAEALLSNTRAVVIEVRIDETGSCSASYSEDR